MPRSLWTGSLSFGLVNVPVMLVSAVKDLDLHFRQLHEKDGAPIETQRWCPKDDAEVPFEEITRSYECDDGTQVTISDLELAGDRAAQDSHDRRRAVRRSGRRRPDLLRPPVFPASVLRRRRRDPRLPSSGRSDGVRPTEPRSVGFVMRAKEYLAIVQARDGALTLTTMRFADEVRSTNDVDAATQKAHKPTAKQLDAAVAVIEELSDEWDPGKYKDRYRARLRSVVQRKRKGQTVKAPDTVKQPSPAPDLMAALEQTLAEMSAESGEQRQEQATATGGEMSHSDEDEHSDEETQKRHSSRRGSASQSDDSDAMRLRDASEDDSRTPVRKSRRTPRGTRTASSRDIKGG